MVILRVYDFGNESGCDFGQRNVEQQFSTRGRDYSFKYVSAGAGHESAGDAETLAPGQAARAEFPPQVC